ncbi:Shiga-like toxin beta subunit [Burkholderia pseudomallei]|uniref:Shiga-like toxin beta subunit n=1 Tax=Burkholderia pseudomallei TaxID=28450 RepID=UPI0005310AA9|nr:Shiga-like toxin beta subunit [Burkholderia pseudomallei]KGS07530.1 hypothetical protein X948_6197 [Burkholderia pseudomallei MSHR5608]
MNKIKIYFGAFVIGSALSANAFASCATGLITSFKYNDGESISVTVDGKDLYTDKWNLQPILFSSYILGKRVEIITSACYNGGGFGQVRILQN